MPQWKLVAVALEACFQVGSARLGSLPSSSVPMWLFADDWAFGESQGVVQQVATSQDVQGPEVVELVSVPASKDFVASAVALSNPIWAATLES